MLEMSESQPVHVRLIQSTTRVTTEIQARPMMARVTKNSFILLVTVFLISAQNRQSTDFMLMLVIRCCQFTYGKGIQSLNPLQLSPEVVSWENLPHAVWVKSSFNF